MADERSWPIGLQRLSIIIGPKAAMQLAESFGGVQDQYIPRHARVDHPFTALIGLDRMEKLCLALGGERIDIPRGTYARLKKAEIIGQRGSARTVALRVGCSMRYVKKIRSVVIEAESCEPDLFNTAPLKQRD